MVSRISSLTSQEINAKKDEEYRRRGFMGGPRITLNLKTHLLERLRALKSVSQVYDFEIIEELVANEEQRRINTMCV